MQLILLFVYERILKRRGYVHRRKIPKPLLVALHIRCLRRMQEFDPKKRRALAWEQLVAYVAPKWSIEYETAHTYLYNERYDSVVADSLLDALIERGFTTLDILAAAEQHLPCNRHRKFEGRTGGCIFNLCPVIRPLPKPRWSHRSRRKHPKICPARSVEQHASVSITEAQ